MAKGSGDAVICTAFLRDLKLAYPDFEIGASITAGDDLLLNNPYITPLKAGVPGVEVVEATYRDSLVLSRQGVPRSFLEAFHFWARKELKLEVPLTDPRPDLHLTDEEKDSRPFPYPYWVVVAGGKDDAPVKIPSFLAVQEVVERTRGRINWVQAGRSHDHRAPHQQAPLKGVENLIDRTTPREFLSLVYHADGVLCGVSFPMTVANAFWRPCVVIAGGREGYCYQAVARNNPALAEVKDKILVPHRYLHTHGRLDCSVAGGCWAHQIVAPHQDSSFPPGYICKIPSREPGGRPIAYCMQLITADEILAAIDSYPTPPARY
jgi:ADP-heptose:LPS heptosyltransferase